MPFDVMACRICQVAVVAVFLAFAGVDALPQAQRVSNTPDVNQLLKKLGDFNPDPCGDVQWLADDGGSFKLYDRLFREAASRVASSLNERAGENHSAKELAVDTLAQLKQSSARINAQWPQENRFHYKVIDLPPIIVTTMSFGTQERFFAFGLEPNIAHRDVKEWTMIGDGDQSFLHPASFTTVGLYPLRRGPSNRPRFLVDVFYSGCAGTSGRTYLIEERAPEQEGGFLSASLTQEGSVGMEDSADGSRPTPEAPFHPKGKLQTAGSRITLPYCWFSGIDWWDNPSMCAVDSYDLSGDEPRFLDRTYNRPELAPISKAIEYAAKKDVQALRGYCSSWQVAKEVMSGPSGSDASDPVVTQIGPGRDRVVLGGGSRFDVERRPQGWVIVSFTR